MITDSIHIRKASLGDISILQELGILTFREAFEAFNSADNMRMYLETAFSDEQMTKELSDRNSEFYLAETGGEAIGYLKLNFADEQTELQDRDGLEIERIYVLKKFYGRKVGQALFKKATEIASQRALKYIWLGVWEENLRAINFYKKNGFLEFGKHKFMLGTDEQTDILMKLTLSKTPRHQTNK
ncbi:MAG: GNAT family N-acetyltransferase [Chitinophagaceae bacterium]|nr:MAG: GNAT family N-acetyltransferase [Chitinophagaceae bacterium]